MTWRRAVQAEMEKAGASWKQLEKDVQDRLLCKQKDAVTQKQLFKTPDFLFIHLLRFSNFSNWKTQTLVVPEEILTLSNGDTYKLVSIADHIGDLIRNGHYVSNVKTEQGVLG